MTATQTNKNETKPKPKPKPKPKENTEKAVETTVEHTKEKAKNPKKDPKAIQKFAAFTIIMGALAVEGLVLFANLSPYMKASNVLTSKALGLNFLTKIVFKPIGWVVGTAGLCAVQIAEIYPLLFKFSKPNIYAKAMSIALIAYGIDCALAVMFWPPLKVSLREFFQAPLMGNINWLNLVIICITIYGGEFFLRLYKTLKETL